MPLSNLDSITIPFAKDCFDVFKFKSSDCSKIFSFNLSKFVFLIAEISVHNMSPPNSSTINSCSNNWFLTFFVSTPGKSHLFTATIIGTPAAFECCMASIVCGFIPSLAATTRITISVIFEPLALISVKAA